MSDPPSPRPYSDRELTLRAISLTFQRASATQHELMGSRSPNAPSAAAATGEEHSETGLGYGLSGAGPSGQGADDAERRAPVEHDLDARPATAGLDEPEEVELPNPIVTDANLRHYLQVATAHRGDAEAEAKASRPARARSALAGRAEQLRFNAAVLHALHQLDHRTRLQQQTIARLEAELAEARRAVGAIEAEEGRPT